VSLDTTGVPAAMLSNSLFGVELRSFYVTGWFGIAAS
jgi:hypothetical protein